MEGFRLNELLLRDNQVQLYVLLFLEDNKNTKEIMNISGE